MNQGKANADLDSDGMTALQEYVADTNLTNSASVFRISCLANNGQVHVRAWTSARRVYQLEQQALTPAGTPWASASAWLLGSDAWQEWPVTNAPAALLRVRVALP